MQEAGFCGKTDPEQLTVASAHCMFFWGESHQPQKVRSFFGVFCLVGGGVNKKSSKHIQTKNPW